MLQSKSDGERMDRRSPSLNHASWSALPDRSTSIPPSDLFEFSKLAAKNGRKFSTSLAELVGGLSKLGIDGPRHLRGPNLDARGRRIGQGAQFDVFEDRMGFTNDIVMKRVRAQLVFADNHVSTNEALRTHLRTLQLEISSLGDPRRRQHPNVVDLVAWGYDYPSSDRSQRLPLLFVEKAAAPLSRYLYEHSRESPGNVSVDIKHQLCLDIAEGLNCVNDSGLAHGDIKPSNILIFLQDHPAVPFTAKLSDFGLCIDLDDDQDSFRSYKGTQGWQPPEIVFGDFDIGEPFSSQLLRKSDSFVFGLLVLSVFFTNGESPFDHLGQEPLKQALMLLDAATAVTLPGPLKHSIVRFCHNTLRVLPQDRVDISSDLLECKYKSYTDWVFVKAQKTSHTPHIPGRKRADLHQRHAYWHGLDKTVVHQLDQQYDDLIKKGRKPMYGAETLFGMAIGLSFVKPPGYKAKALKYIAAAADLSYVPAQGIVKRLCEAQDQSGTADIETEKTKEWLLNAASEGSYIAAADLAKEDPRLFESAKAAFGERGGYNQPLSNTAITKYEAFRNDHESFAHTEGVNSFVDLQGNRMLHIVAMLGPADKIHSLVKKGASINAQNDAGETPLYKACLAGKFASVEALWELSADASITSRPFGISCLHWLFAFDEDVMTKVTDLLVSRGAHVRAKTRLLREEKYVRQIPWEHFPFHWPIGSPIHWSSFTGSFNAIKVLLDFDAMIDDLDSDEEDRAQTALSMAMYRGDSSMVSFLLSKGADPQRIDNRGRTPTHMLSTQYTEINTLFIMSKSLHWWIYHGSLETHLTEVSKCLSAISAAGGDIQSQSRRISPSMNPNTPLIDAANYGDGGVVLGMLSAGVSANCVEPWSGNLPFHIWAGISSRRLAYAKTFERVFQKLLEMTEDVNAREKLYGRTALHLAVYAPFENDFKYLAGALKNCSHKVDMNSLDKHGDTPLLLALEIKTHIGEDAEAEIRSDFLRSLGADVAARNHDGCDWLWKVCKNDKLSHQSCLSLIQKRMETLEPAEQRRTLSASIHSSRKTTALMAAVANRYEAVVDYLLTIGADPNIVSKAKMTALDYALDAGQFCRQQHLTIWFSSRMLVLEDCYKPKVSEDALFEKTFTEGDLGSHNVNGLDLDEKERYFAIPAIINKLVTAGARRARDLIPDAEELGGPRTWDKEAVEIFGEELEGYSAEKQPFYQNWKVLYEMLDD